MRNTDRGADNYMIKCCEAEHDNSLVDVAPSRFTQSSMPQMSELRREPSVNTAAPNGIPGAQPVSRSGSGQPPYTRKPHIHIAAIDNSLSFPHEHPKGWRSYTYGVRGLLACAAVNLMNLLVAIPTSKRHRTTVQPKDKRPFPSPAYIQAMVGGNNFPAPEDVRRGSWLPSDNVCCGYLSQLFPHI